MEAKKLREKSNFAENWNTEFRKTRKKPNFTENWNTETREKRKLNESWNENRILYFKFVKNNTAFNNSLLQWRLLASLF